MKTNIARVLIVCFFVVTLGAGVAAGLLAAKLPAVSSQVVMPSDASLAGQLNLTAEQAEKMRKIWEGVRDLSRESYRTAIKDEQQRDSAIRALIPAEKLSAYNEILRNYAEQGARLKGNREAVFDQAVKETRAILTDSQRAKYDEILKKRLGEEEGHGHDPLGDSSG